MSDVPVDALPLDLAPRTSARPYYGWACVAAAALAMVATMPGRTMGVGLITEPLIHDLGIARTTYANINVPATLIGAIFGLGAGRLIDRFGVRIIIFGVTFLLGLVVLAMTAIRGPAGLFVTITLSRGLGQSALSVASIALVGKWFVRRVGYAMAVYSVLLTFGFMGAFPALEGAINDAGWKPAWGGMGVVLAALVAPLLWLVARNSPEAIGQPIDGIPPAAGQTISVAVGGYTLAEALATPAFWALGVGALLLNTAYSGFQFFPVAILRERGYHGPVSFVVMTMTFVALPTNFAAGWLASRTSMTRLMGAAMLFLSASLLALPHVSTTAHIMLFAATLGISAGMVTVVFFACWGKLYGRVHLGKIQGAAQAITVLASAIGPMILAQCQARTGSYMPAFFYAAPITAVFGIGCLLIKEPASK